MFTHKKNHLDNFDSHELLFAAFRYFLGRKTISNCNFAEELASAWWDIPEITRNGLQRELTEAFARDDQARLRGEVFVQLPLGQNCDREAWEKVRTAWSTPEE
jgi:hypothetical protein